MATVGTEIGQIASQITTVKGETPDSAMSILEHYLAYEGGEGGEGYGLLWRLANESLLAEVVAASDLAPFCLLRRAHASVR